MLEGGRRLSSLVDTTPGRRTSTQPTSSPMRANRVGASRRSWVAQAVELASSVKVPSRSDTGRLCAAIESYSAAHIRGAHIAAAWSDSPGRRPMPGCRAGGVIALATSTPRFTQLPATDS